MKLYKCENCRLRKYAEKNPKTLLGRFWHWHKKWCPGWKAYMKAVSAPIEKKEDSDPHKNA